jgi:hypothetical protein
VVRAGSIGRDSLRTGERTEPPPEEAGNLGPHPIHEEISALWFQAEHTDPQTVAALSLYANLRSMRVTTRD